MRYIVIQELRNWEHDLFWGSQYGPGRCMSMQKATYSFDYSPGYVSVIEEIDSFRGVFVSYL